MTNDKTVSDMDEAAWTKHTITPEMNYDSKRVFLSGRASMREESDETIAELRAENEDLRDIISKARLEIYWLWQQADGDRKILENATIHTDTGGVVPQLYARMRQVPKPRAALNKDTTDG